MPPRATAAGTQHLEHRHRRQGASARRHHGPATPPRWRPGRLGRPARSPGRRAPPPSARAATGLPSPVAQPRAARCSAASAVASAPRTRGGGQRIAPGTRVACSARARPRPRVRASAPPPPARRPPIGNGGQDARGGRGARSITTPATCPRGGRSPPVFTARQHVGGRTGACARSTAGSPARTSASSSSRVRGAPRRLGNPPRPGLPASRRPAGARPGAAAELVSSREAARARLHRPRHRGSAARSHPGPRPGRARLGQHGHERAAFTHPVHRWPPRAPAERRIQGRAASVHDQSGRAPASIARGGRMSWRPPRARWWRSTRAYSHWRTIRPAGARPSVLRGDAWRRLAAPRHVHWPP